MNEVVIVDIIWDKIKAFQNQTPPFHIPGRLHTWHKNFSLPYTKVLGIVACQVTPKLGEIRAAERSWGCIKHIKNGKR